MTILFKLKQKVNRCVGYIGIANIALFTKSVNYVCRISLIAAMNSFTEMPLHGISPLLVTGPSVYRKPYHPKVVRTTSSKFPSGILTPREKWVITIPHWQDKLLILSSRNFNHLSHNLFKVLQIWQEALTFVISPFVQHCGSSDESDTEANDEQHPQIGPEYRI